MMTLDWKISNSHVPYDEALNHMEQRNAEIIAGTSDQQIWFLEHPPLYTAGTSAEAKDYTGKFDFPVYQIGRGGQYTYHGPGQRVAYVMLDLKKYKQDVRCFVHFLEEWIIQTLAEFGVISERRKDRIGIWVVTKEGEKKIAAIGIRLKKWVTMHGIAINVDPDLTHFSGIVPCGISSYGVTSLKELGVDVSMSELDKVLKEKWAEVFKQSYS